MKAKSILLILTICVISLLSINKAEAANGNFKGGDGSLQNPYLIEDINDLKAIRETAYINKGFHFKLVNDLDLSGENWIPIGDGSISFKGYFDGNNKTISNLSIMGTDLSYQGLFGFTVESEIKKLNLVNVTIECSGNSTGVGSIAGHAFGTSINDCSSSGTISGTTAVGGIVGYFDCLGTGSKQIVRCNFSGNIIGVLSTGGIAGFQQDGEITYCTSNANISGAGAGEITGMMGGGAVVHYNFANGTIENTQGGGNRIIGTSYHIDHLSSYGYNYKNNYASPSMTVDGVIRTSQDNASLDGVDCPKTEYNINPLLINRNIDINEPLIFTFNKYNSNPLIYAVTNVMKPNTGNIIIYRADGSVFEVIQVTDTKVLINNATVMINHEPFEYDESYYVNIDTGAFIDFFGFETTGISDNTTWTFTSKSGGSSLTPITPNINVASDNGGGYIVTINTTSQDVENIEYRIYKDSSLYTDWSKYMSEIEITETGSYSLEAKATDVAHNVSPIVQKTFTVTKGQPNGNGGYVITPHEDSAYTIERTADDLTAITINQTGFKIITVDIEAAIGHVGNETVVFVHMRNGVQIGLSALRADFDTTTKATACFNVSKEDVVKVYIVDKLTNDTNSNPNIL